MWLLPLLLQNKLKVTTLGVRKRAGKTHCRKTLLPRLLRLLCCYFCWSFLSVSPSIDDVCCCLTGCPSVWPLLLLIAHSLPPLWSNEWQFVIYLHVAIALHLFLPYTLFDLCVYAVFFFNMKETEAIYVNNYSIFPKARNEHVLPVFSAQKRRLEK